MKLILAFALTVACVSAASLESIVSPGFPEGRIINGKPASKGAAPYIVSLNSGSHFCAGSIINEKWVATAAHCLIYDSFQVIAGLHERNDESDVQVRRVASKAQQIIHEKYSGGVGPYDIGLIYIAEPFDLNTLSRDGSAPVAKISLPSGNYQQTGQGALYGWGRNNVGAVPNALQTLDVNIIGYAECKAALPSSAPIHPVNICTHTPGAIDGACNGDSGGPLIINTEDGSELVGIVSWGYNPCATTTYPSVFTSVSTQMSWIAEKVNSYKP